MKKSLLIFSIIACHFFAHAQDRWQQAVDYTMEVDFDAKKHQFKGKQTLVYTNNSPDQLDKVFYHLYYNAFQPNSMMDVRSRTIADPDKRVQDFISKLAPNEIGYHKIKSLKQNGQPVSFKVVGTVLEVILNQPIGPKSKTTFEMVFESQVPKQIRRTGRDSKEGIEYSMSQWYPKMAEYDYEGWHAHPYIGREFHGVWGNFDVKIKIDKAFTLGGTGIIQNPNVVGKGYQSKGTKVKSKGKKLTWHFKAEKVHDFMWAADRDYIHTKKTLPNGTILHFLYQPDVTTNWEKLPNYMVRSFELMKNNFGEYPYKQFSFIQGGDGGMEYPMATLIVGRGKLERLVGVSVHESIHNWYYGVLASNESMYPWMDEGFTSYAEDFVMDKLFEHNSANPFAAAYRGYFYLAKSGEQEVLSTHGDHYNKNRTYSISSYSMGELLLHQLSYVIGQETFTKGMKLYFNTWKFKHPNPTDFKRVMEKVSGLELDWYFDYWIKMTHHIDYGIKSVTANKNAIKVILEKKGRFPMPIDLVVTLKSGKTIQHYIPLRIMRGEKTEKVADEMKLEKDWGWVYPTYELTLPYPESDIKSIEIDPSTRMADINRSNNTYK